MEREAQETVGLLPDRRHHSRVVGAGVAHADAAGEIDVPVAVHIGEGGPADGGDEDRMLLTDAALIVAGIAVIVVSYRMARPARSREA